MIYWIAYVLWKLLSYIYYPVTACGKEHLPKKGGFILASNHLSYMDPMMIGICFYRRLSYVARDTLFKNKLSRFFLNQVGAFPIKRDASDIGAIKQTIKRLKAGMPVLLFPEGTRIRHQKKVHPGIGLIAVKSGFPVIPVYIVGSNRVLPPGRKFLKRHPIRVYFGKPKKYSADSAYGNIASQILQDIHSLSKKA